MNDAESLRNEALRLLTSINGATNSAEAMNTLRRAMGLISLANRVGRHSSIMTEQSTLQQVITPGH